MVARSHSGSSRPGLTALLLGGGLVGLGALYVNMRTARPPGAEHLPRDRPLRGPLATAGDSKPHDRCLCRTHQAGATASKTADLPALAWRLGHPTGAGITGRGAADFLRAVFVELLITGPARTRVVIGRAELNGLFGDHVDAVPWQAFFPRLQVHELLEDAIEQLEMDIWMAEAESANLDLLRGNTRKSTRTYWFTTPGADSDVVLQTLQQAHGHNLAGLMLGPWPHDRTYTLGEEDPPLGAVLPPPHAVPSRTIADAVARLRLAARAA